MSPVLWVLIGAAVVLFLILVFTGKPGKNTSASDMLYKLKTGKERPVSREKPYHKPRRGSSKKK